MSFALPNGNRYLAMAHKRPRPRGGDDDPFEDFTGAASSSSRPSQPSHGDRDGALTTDELFRSETDEDADGNDDNGDSDDEEEPDITSRLQSMLEDSEGEDDADSRPKKKKRKGPGKFVVIHTQPMHRGRLRASNLVDIEAESQLLGPDPAAEATEAAICGSDAAAGAGLMEVPARGFIETDIPMDSSESSDSEDEPTASPPAAGLNVEDLCAAYTEALRSQRMPPAMARSFTNWRCWYCKHREEMRQIPAAKRSTVMKAFGTALEQYETETLETQASILYQLWAEAIFQPSLRGERDPIAEDDTMTVERFMICLRDHISPTERPMAAVSHMTRQLILLLDLTSDYWEVTNTVEDENGNTRQITGLNHRAISVHLSAAKLLAGLITSSSGGRFKKPVQPQHAATATESEAIHSGLRLRAVRRGTQTSRQFI